MTLIGYRYLQSNDPGAVGLGYQWHNSTTGEVFERNLSNTKWVKIYNSNSDSGGLIRESGCKVSGPLILEVSEASYAKADSHNFSTALTLGGAAVATTAYVDGKVIDYIKNVDNIVAAAVNSESSDLLAGISNSFAVFTGSIDYRDCSNGGNRLKTLTMPTYANSVVASEVDCKWFVSVYANNGFFPEQVSDRGCMVANDKIANSRALVTMWRFTPTSDWTPVDNPRGLDISLSATFSCCNDFGQILPEGFVLMQAGSRIHYMTIALK